MPPRKETVKSSISFSSTKARHSKTAFFLAANFWERSLFQRTSKLSANSPSVAVLISSELWSARRLSSLICTLLRAARRSSQSRCLRRLHLLAVMRLRNAVHFNRSCWMQRSSRSSPTRSASAQLWKNWIFRRPLLLSASTLSIAARLSQKFQYLTPLGQLERTHSPPAHRWGSSQSHQAWRMSATTHSSMQQSWSSWSYQSTWR